MLYKSLSLTLVLSLIIGLTACSQSKKIFRIDGSSTSSQEIDKIVNELMDSANVTGLCLAVLNNNRIAYINAYGYRNRDTRELLDNNTIIGGASFSKVVLAYIAMQLIQEGLLSLDEPLYTYLEKPLTNYDSFKDLSGDEQWKLLTARHCLSHTTGFPNHRILNPRQYGKLEFFFKPGTRYSYSGEGICLMQFVIEQITGAGLEELAVERVFKPLGMTRTSFIWQERFEDNYAVGHNIIEIPLDYQRTTIPNGGGSLLTCIADYAIFIEAMMQSTGLDESTRRQMLTPSIRIRSKQQFPALSNEVTDKYDSLELSYGLGWGLIKTDYGPAFFKEGHGHGWQNYNINFIDQKTSIIIMTNSDNGESIFKYLLERIIGDRFTVWEWEGYIPYDLIQSRSIGVYLYDVILLENADRAVKIYREIKASSLKRKFVFNEDELNDLGYQMIKEDKLEAAIKLFELNVEEYPKSASVFDSLGEAYYMSGQIERAIECYKKSLDLNPDNENAKKMLEHLQK